MLESNRLILRTASLEDAPLLYKLNADPDVMRFTGETAFSTMLDAQNIIREKMIPGFDKFKMTRFLVFLKDETFLGWCGLKYSPETKEVDLGYRFMKKQWGNGYATEASKISLAYGFHTLNLPRIIAKAMPDNTGSIKVMQKLGMTFKGYVKDPTDTQSYILYEMLQKDFNQ